MKEVALLSFYALTLTIWKLVLESQTRNVLQPNVRILRAVAQNVSHHTWQATEVEGERRANLFLSDLLLVTVQFSPGGKIQGPAKRLTPRFKLQFRWLAGKDSLQLEMIPDIRSGLLWHLSVKCYMHKIHTLVICINDIRSERHLLVLWLKP